MDMAPPDTKRQRLSLWSQPASLPYPHPHPQPPHSFSHAPTAQLPPPSHLPSSGPPLPPSPQHQLPAPGHPLQPCTSRSSDHSSAPPTPGIPVHGHAPFHPDVDRRHHEQELLAPMQDPYRQPPPPPQHPPPHQHHYQPPPPPHQQPQQQQQQQQQPPPPPPQQQPQQQQQSQPLSPAHSHTIFHPLPPRDSAIKREPEDLHRPSSTGHAPESLPPTPQIMSSHLHPHPHSQPPPPFQDSQARHVNYETGPPVPPTPSGYRTSTYGPPTPSIPNQPQYEQSSSYQSQPDPFYGVYPSNVSKKKNTRASQACDQCRQLKAKCDETKPCKTCRDKGTECRYRDPVPKATDKAQADILEGIQSIQNTLSTLSRQIGHIDDRVTEIETIVGRKKGAPPLLKRDSSFDDDSKSGSLPPDERPEPSYEDDPQDQPVGPTELNPISMMVDDDVETEPGPPVPPGEPAIPINHTTLAGLLLDWDPIKLLTRTHLEQAGIRYISEYPIGIEQVRGLLKVYGRGEDTKTARLLKDGGDHGSVDMADDVSDIASSSPAADWGQLGSLSPGDQVIYQSGVLGVDGNPDFTESKIWYYVESFKTNILNMHPIIQPHLIEEWVRYFLDSLPVVTPRAAKPMVSKSTFAVTSTLAETVGSKRKRSSPIPDGASASSNSMPVRAGRPSRSVHSALVLLIVALGKICLHRENVPDVVYHPDPPFLQSNGGQESPSIRNGVPPSPVQGSPPGLAQSQHHSSGLPSPKEQERNSQSRRSSLHGGSSVRTGFSLKKNYEVIPGLEYFALATDILGNQYGAYNSLKNVYANIFAGLYHGQLSRPLESFAYIHKAGHTLQVLMRPSLDRLRKVKQNSGLPLDTKSNDFALAFWTCLQLESDLIAELPLPPSGLLQYEDDMPQPNMSLLRGFDQRVMDSYLGQLYLRKHLNSIHRMFYSPDDPNGVESDKFRNVRLVADAISSMNWVSPSFSFKETDLPASDILSARLRAKYWGAQVITYRPFIRQILQWSYEKEHHPSSPNAVLSEFKDGIIAPHIPPRTIASSDLPPSIIELAQKGIKALIESTRAFHWLGKDRPIITNVFGTAHAQWGNMLVLTAAFKDPILNEFIDKGLLKQLFERTIYFLRQSATVTSSLKIDMLILDGLYKDLFFGITESVTNSGFPRTAGAQTPKLPMAAPPSVPYVANDLAVAQSVFLQPQVGHPHGQ